jgi:hypothetical protein
MRSAIDDLGLDLRGVSVLTEAASGPFAVTPVLAAMAGAERVFAVGRDSQWGHFADVTANILSLAAVAGCSEKIEFGDRPAIEYAPYANVVTNLGFVRPINAALVAQLPGDAAVPLMWEPWEYRHEDIDLSACRVRRIPVLGTNECHPRLQIFAYLAKVAIRLLLERDVEVERSNLLLIASDPFGSPMEEGLRSAGAEVVRADPLLNLDWVESVAQKIGNLDAIIVAEHRSASTVVGLGGLSASQLAAAGIELIHICGELDEAALAVAGLAKYPARSVPRGIMTVTTDYAGPRPVIDLHAAGLAVGGQLVQLLRSGKDEAEARAIVVAGGLGVDFPEVQ